jgi:hypothetical protein
MNTALLLMKGDDYKETSGAVQLKYQDSRAKVHENPCTN